jgi:drug/metabolite transporter (DMT)-like permease
MDRAVRAMLLTTAAMIAFAANSLICRMAFQGSGIDPGSFTAIRIATGAVTLCLLVAARRGAVWRRGSWGSALALFIYAATFSWAYQTLPAGVGALLLFGAVQATMVTYGLLRGESLRALQWAALLLAMCGLLGLLLPGAEAPEAFGSLCMLTAGISWGVYSLRGKMSNQPLADTAGNFLRAVVPAVLVLAVAARQAHFSWTGALLATLSGAVTSGLGYVIWYAAVRALTATTAAIVQLSVPVIAAVGAVILLNEPVTRRLVWSSLAILGGIAGVILLRRTQRPIEVPASASAADIRE